MSGHAVKPAIGITTYQEDASWRGWHRHASLVPTDFIEPIKNAGGVPVLLPPAGADDEAAVALAGLDGVVVVGGPDIDPVLYGAPPDRHSTGFAPDRDTWESALFRHAIAGDLAILGVCRGMQMINVLCGGTLLTHLPDVVHHDGHQPALPEFNANQVTFDIRFQPGLVLGERREIACYHHQALDTLGEGVVATGWSSDGAVESICVPDRRFVVGIQGHPEVGPVVELFAALVAAARERRVEPGDAVRP